MGGAFSGDGGRVGYDGSRIDPPVFNGNNGSLIEKPRFMTET